MVGWLVPVAVLAGAALVAPGSGWPRWALAGTAGVVGICWLMWLLLGAGARRLAQAHDLTDAERAELSVKDRVDAVTAARGTLIQSATGLVVIGGVAFTALGLWFTAQTLHTGQQGQITDRYTSAIAQLGSPDQEVRLGGIYALERIADDSPRDQSTIMSVLASYIRVHAQDKPPAGSAASLQAEDPGGRPPPGGQASFPAVDVSAAFTVIGRRSVGHDHGFVLDLSYVDLHGKILGGMNLSSADLTGSVLTGTDLADTNMTGADLDGGHLADANLVGTDLKHATLVGADLTGAYLIGAQVDGADLSHAMLVGADLTGAYLIRAQLESADLSGARLSNAGMSEALLAGADLEAALMVDADMGGADLSGANLSAADLSGANLEDADLRDMRGQTPAQIRSVAHTNQTTRF